MTTNFTRRNAVAFMTSVLCMIALGTGCATKTVAPSPSAMNGSSIAPSLVIERFLQAANAKDLDTMAQIFGTNEGPFNRMGSKKEIDDRMFTFATVLRHTDFEIKGEGDPVSGRRDEAKNILVEISRGDDKVLVPFRMVKYKNTWLIEDLCMNKLTGTRSTCE